jgi:hypothetical protein
LADQARFLKRQALTIRRLDKIVNDRRVIWRDERG